MQKQPLIVLLLLIVLGFSCSKQENPGPNVPVVPSSFSLDRLRVNGQFSGFSYEDIGPTPELKFTFTAPISKESPQKGIQWKKHTGEQIPYTLTFENGDSTLTLSATKPLDFLSGYTLSFLPALESRSGGKLRAAFAVELATRIDSTDKFTRITDEALLTLVQKQTFAYFWDFAHPVSGLARERNTSGDLVTSGGSGFGIMAIPVAVERAFITRQQGLERTQKIVTFLKDKVQTFHGAFPHWLHGGTGEAIAFSAKDNGADLVETSFLMQGLLTVRQYFDSADPQEAALRADINSLWKAVEWSWFQKNKEPVLYWHWSPTFGWEMNHAVRGWNESLITYVLAAASSEHSIEPEVYHQGWARNGAMANGNTFFGHQLPLGENLGGPLFFAHYSFLGLNPNGLTDRYANYFTQNRNHSLINQAYCIQNPKGFRGYSDECWGLTASDIPNGYTANSPTNDRGVITPTAALSSMPYTPEESMKALRFFYYKLGDKLWGRYGFYDAFSLHERWFADSYLAIDQGPIVVMLENHRTGLPWKLFMSCPEVKAGLTKLDFESMAR
ncbi:glucoamylase family protein [Arundinibacter roseus]|uniref:Beta-glucosidase n=1 Tax=Arundinibacter roseus TaxID=2070510 RepID=A0A4R4K4N7_9BACT|nr:glucoamylase family protein [Arundinibacter roseus]TDB62340.1 beta-glucosidase [Arundinibacter roseus]